MEIYCVPGHLGVEKNERADEAAKNTVEKVDRKRYPEQFSSLAHIRRRISERKWKEAKEWFKTVNDRRLPLQ